VRVRGVATRVILSNHRLMVKRWRCFKVARKRRRTMIRERKRREEEGRRGRTKGYKLEQEYSQEETKGRRRCRCGVAGAEKRFAAPACRCLGRSGTQQVGTMCPSAWGAGKVWSDSKSTLVSWQGSCIITARAAFYSHSKRSYFNHSKSFL